MKLIVTAGPTREPIDEVRFLSNHSTGRQGLAIAEEATGRSGWEVTLICGPISLAPPVGIRLIEVQTAEEMHRAVQGAFPDCDCLVMAAAVADYRPAHPTRGKLKKTAGPRILQLERTVDILAECGRKKRNQILVGFALEFDELEANARQKLQQKNLDLVVANSLEAFASTHSNVLLLHTDGTQQEIPYTTKREIAVQILNAIETIRGALQNP